MILAIVRFQEPLLAATTPLNSLLLLRVFVGLIASSPRDARFRILYDSKHVVCVAIGVAHVWRNIAFVRICNEFLFQLKCNNHVSAHVFGHAGDAGDECVDTAASLGMEASSPKTTFQNFGARVFSVAKTIGTI